MGFEVILSEISSTIYPPYRGFKGKRLEACRWVPRLKKSVRGVREGQRPMERNEELVKRGEFYLSPIFLKNWYGDLGEMNEVKIRREAKSPRVHELEYEE